MFDEGYPISVVSHHSGDVFATAESAARLNDLGINALPTLLPDGGPEPSYPYSHQILENTINERMAIDAPCTIAMTGSLINGEITVNVTVNRDNGATIPNARVQVVVTEIDIQGNYPTYNNEMNFVNRDMILDSNGTDLTFNGNIAEASVTGTLDQSWNQDNLIIVVWVENGSTIEVFQAKRESIEIFLADPNAPAIPNNFVGVPNASGALSCDLSWTNPSLNFAGGSLTELLETRLYRDGVLIYTDSTPAIGGTGNYTDIPVESGLFNYMVSGYNTSGEGPGAITTIWVGEDVPGAVEDLLLEDVGGDAYLTWVNPTAGLHGGAFNSPISGYTIERSDGSVIDLPGVITEFTDSTLPTGEFYYTIQPYNLIGDGGSATSNSVFFGDGSLFNVYIVCDDYASETTWNIVDSGSNVIYSGGPYSTAGEIVDLNCMLGVGDFVFTIYDSFGDGICCSYGDGYYTLSLEGEVIFEGSGEFTTEESTSFTVEGGPVFNPPVNLVVESNSTDNFATFTWEVPAMDDPTGYDVYLDGVNFGNTVDLDWIFNDLENGVVYEAGVVAVYDDGFSPLVLVEFTFAGTGTNDLPEIVTVLHNNYPNPFNPTTNIAFSLDEATYTTLEVYNIKGEKVRTLIESELPADHHSVIWHGTDNNNKPVSSGVYFYKMKAGNYQETKKMILMK